jgi:dipeptidyl aminopeptidase/acylaminoacyl peptidase
MILPALLLLLVSSGPLQAAKKPITHEMMWELKRVGAPVPSPDGKWVVFSLVEPSYDPKEQVSDLWIVPSDASAPPRRLTSTKAGESDVAWAGDSRRLVFAAKRDGDEDAQIYLLDLAGGEAQRITQQIGGASSPLISPDGKSLLYQGTFDPLAASRKGRKYNVRVFDTFPIRQWDHWLDEKRPHIFEQPLEPGAKAKDLLAETKLAGEKGFDGVLGSSGSDLQAVWSPDGASVIFVATTNENQGAYANVVTHLYQMAAAGGEPKPLTSGKDSFTAPYFRPDGKALYAILEKDSPKVYNQPRIAMWSWPTPGAMKIVSAELDRPITSFAVTPDNRTLYTLAEDAGHEKLYSLPAEGGSASLAFDVPVGAYSNLRIPARGEGALLIANWESSVNPFEVVKIHPAAKKHTNLTDFNAAKITGIDWQPPRHFWLTAKNGRKIHNMIFLPPAFDESRKYPLITFIHGGANLMARDQFHTRWNYHLLAAPGYVILTTNYTGSTGFGEAFAQAIQGDPLKGPGEEINEAVDEAVKRFPFVDGSRLAAGGASYGGHLTNWLEATTTRYQCLFSHAGLINLESQWGTSDTIYSREITNGGPVWEQGPIWRKQNPIRLAANFKTPILLTVGENDFRVPLNQTIEHWSVLQRRRVPSRLLVFPDENHWILKAENNRYFFQELHGWLAKYLN